MPSQWRIYFSGLHWPQMPGYHGGEIRDFYLLKALTEIGDVWGYFLYSEGDGRFSLKRNLRGFKVDETAGTKRGGRFTLTKWYSRFLRWAYARGIPLPLRYPVESVRYATWLKAGPIFSITQDILHLKPYFVFVSPQLNPLPLLLPAHRQLASRWILASYDVESERLKRLLGSSTGIFTHLARWWDAYRAPIYERALLKAVDGLLAVSERDKILFHNLYDFPRERIFVAPNGVDVEYFAFQGLRSQGARTVLFVGNLAYPPNHAAAKRLITNIMPLVRRQFPDTKLLIVGRSPDKSLLRLATRLDYIIPNVPDVRPYYQKAQVVCIPLEFGSGTKLKVLEALSVGKPVVASSIALEGIDGVQEYVVVAESDAEFAERICDTLRSPMRWQRRVRRARYWVERNYSWQVSFDGLSAWMERILVLPPYRETSSQR